MSKHLTFLVAALSAGALALPVSARDYKVIADWGHINGTGSSTSYISGAWADGSTLYSCVSTPARLTKTANLTTWGGNTSGEIYSELTSNSAFSNAGVGQTTGTGGTVNVVSAIYGFSAPAGQNYIQFSESSSDSVYRVDKSTGAITRYLSRADIMAVTGQTAAQLNAANDSAPDGEYVAYDTTSGQFLKTTGAGTAQVFISSSDLTTYAGGAVQAQGVTFDAAGNFYFISKPTTVSQQGIYKRDTSGAISLILTYADVSLADGNASPSFKDIFAAPDGYIYLNDNASTGRSIVRFKPSDAAGTVTNFLSEADLLAGPAGTSNAIQTFSWYDDGAGNYGIAFNLANATTGIKGFYAVPEPASVLLLGLGFLALRSRRSGKRAGL